MAGIYIHIPFCSQACHYCDFHFSTNQTLVKEVADAICIEIELQKNYLAGEKIDTVYFGGGTPSILSYSDLEKILNAIRKSFVIGTLPEITLEANPEDLSNQKLKALRGIGINRLSIGVQSFDDYVLQFLNRSHRGEDARQAVVQARQTGFDNINVDLIYAIPDRDISKLTQDINNLIQLNPEHISAYSLTIEEKTAFGKWVASKKFAPVSEEENASQFELVMGRLTNAGYDHYEISNYSKLGNESKHNSNYWKQIKYLGIGPSAHSFNGISRQANISNNNAYIKSIQENKIPAVVETLTRADRVNEYLMTSLRTKWGCDLKHLKDIYHFDLLTKHADLVQSSIRNNLVKLNGNTLTLTRLGKMHADKLSSDLFLIN